MKRWKKLLDQDARQGEIYEKGRNEVRKSEDNLDENSRERLGSGEEFLACQPNKNLTQEERKSCL